MSRPTHNMKGGTMWQTAEKAMFSMVWAAMSFIANTMGMTTGAVDSINNRRCAAQDGNVLQYFVPRPPQEHCSFISYIGDVLPRHPRFSVPKSIQYKARRLRACLLRASHAPKRIAFPLKASGGGASRPDISQPVDQIKTAVAVVPQARSERTR